MRKVKHDIPPALKTKLNELGWSISTLAKEAGIGDQRLYANLRGDTAMGLDTALKLLEVLGYSIQGEGKTLLLELQQHYETRKNNKRRQLKLNIDTTK